MGQLLKKKVNDGPTGLSSDGSVEFPLRNVEKKTSGEKKNLRNITLM
jgi:hypothetical protein